MAKLTSKKVAAVAVSTADNLMCVLLFNEKNNVDPLSVYKYKFLGETFHSYTQQRETTEKFIFQANTN